MRWRHLTKCQRQEDAGSITLWTAVLATSMIVLVGFAVDGAGAVLAKQRTHAVAAQAARAGGQQLQGGLVMRGKGARPDPAQARVAAENYLQGNGTAGLVTVVGNTIDVQAHDQYRTKVLGIIGIGEINVTGHSRAQINRTVEGQVQ